MTEAYKHLTQVERCQIEAYLSSGDSMRSVARKIGRNVGTISREVKRNRNPAPDSNYEGASAHQQAVTRRSEASRVPRKVTPTHLDRIHDRLVEGHSPDVIANGLGLTGHLRLSTPWIYQLIDREVVNGDDDFKTLLWRKYRKRPSRFKASAGVHLIPDRVDIQDRPPEVETREQFGHWEGDTIVGAHHQGAIVTLLERRTRYLKCFAVNARTKDAVADGIIRMMGPLAATVRTITFDNGGEFAAHERIAAALDCDIFFARPYKSCERGANENANGLLRRHFPKGESLIDVDPDHLQWSEDILNAQRRKSLDFKTAQTCFEAEREAIMAHSPPS